MLAARRSDGAGAMSLSVAVAFDLLVLCACGGLLVTRGGISHSHPAVLYLIFHALVVSSRAYAVVNGAPTFFSSVPAYEAVRTEELARAVLYADAALVAATLGWLSAARRSSGARRRRRLLPMGAEGYQGSGKGAGRALAPTDWRPLELKYVHRVAFIAFPLGVIVFARYGFVPGVGVGGAVTSSYFVLALTWPGLMLVALIYVRGFKPRYLVPLAVYFGFIAIQGAGRFRLILPLVLLVQIHLDRHGRRWPSPKLTVLLVALAVVFFPLKEIGRSIQEGRGASTIRSAARSSIDAAASGRSDDQAILDELAMTISLSNESNKTFFGRPYLNVLVLPVPRPLWVGKPGLADYLKEISKPTRPLDVIGGVTTLPGDLYLNFRLPGVIVIMFLLARLSARLYVFAYKRPYMSVARFGFLILASNLVEIYRDGLISVPVFFLIQMLPLLLIIGLHLRQPARRLPRARPAPLLR